MRAPDLAKHVRARWPVLASGGVLLAVLGVASAAVPAESEGAVADALGRASRGRVAPDGFLWLSSDGAWDDLVDGRRVAFLSAAEEGAPRDVYWARVRALPSGRILGVREIVRVTRTAAADERDLTADGGHFAFAAAQAGQYRSVSFVDAARPGEVRAFGLAKPAGALRFELQSGARLVAEPAGGEPFAVAMADGASVGGAEVAHTTRVVASADVEPARPAAPGAPPPREAQAELALHAGWEPALRRGESGDRQWVELDPRQLDFALVPGQSAEWPGGGVPDGRRAIASRMRRPVVALSFDVVGGGFAGSFALGPLTPQGLALGTTPQGEITLAPFEPSVAEPRADTAIQWGSRGGGGRHWICSTPEGKLLVAWSSSADPETSWGCAAGLSASGALVAATWGADLTLEEPLAATTLLAFEHDWAPATPPPVGGSWAPAPAPQPAPAFIPAVYDATTRVFEREVRVTRFDVSRFELRIVAGSAEKSHRLGGEFVRALPDADVPRAQLSLPLGVGKRKAPRGLKTGGSLGHRFSRREGVLAVGSGVIRVVEGGAWEAEREALDATELPLTIARGQLARAARERGPVQPRVDVCVLGGELLVAESELDSHEASAEALLRVGCESAVALDRGSEAPVTLQRGSIPAVAPETRLIGLERPLARVPLTRW